MAQFEVPRHVGIIPDGNRRWAKERGLPVFEGHRRGYETIKPVAYAAFDAGVEYMTIYAFSTENWQRTNVEIRYLMDLFYRVATSELKDIHEKGVRLRILGSREGLSKRLNSAFDKAQRHTEGNKRGTLSLCLNYGGLQEISDAVAAIVRSGVSAEDVTPELVEQNLYSPEVPSVDLVIRSSGEQRLSGFMLWRAAYAEMLFSEKLWPDFEAGDFMAALDEFRRRKRRFGK